MATEPATPVCATATSAGRCLGTRARCAHRDSLARAASRNVSIVGRRAAALTVSSGPVCVHAPTAGMGRSAAKSVLAAPVSRAVGTASAASTADANATRTQPQASTLEFSALRATTTTHRPIADQPAPKRTAPSAINEGHAGTAPASTALRTTTLVTQSVPFVAPDARSSASRAALACALEVSGGLPAINGALLRPQTAAGTAPVTAHVERRSEHAAAASGSAVAHVKAPAPWLGRKCALGTARVTTA